MAPSRTLVLHAFLVLVAHMEEEEEYIQQLQQQFSQVYILMVMLLSGTCAAMTTMHGFRRTLGNPHSYSRGQYENVCSMMQDSNSGGNPDQFYRLFRMSTNTFRWFRDALWDHVYPPNRCNRRGPKPSREVFERKLLQTLDFLASGDSYEHLSFTWGMTLCWKELLIEEIAGMSDKFIKWPQNNAFLDICKGFERVRGFKGCCGCIDGTFIKIRAPWSQDQNPGEYNTYKKYYAIQLLAVCAPNMLFTYVHAGESRMKRCTFL